MKRELYDRIITYCESHHMIEYRDRIVIGFSGGADSVFLCCFLKELAGQMELKLHAVHVNHRIRREAGRDEEFCRQLSRRLSIPLTVYTEDIPRLAREQGMSEEEAGRCFRYQCMEEFCNEHDFGKIAVAHHRDDQAETVLFQLLRGSALRGLGGMRPVRGRIIRPLLTVSRREIEESLRNDKITWCTDATNLEDDYARNRIRHHILPALEEFAGGRAAEHICRTAEQMREYYDYLEGETDRIWSESVRTSCHPVRRCEIVIGSLSGLPAVLQRELILRMIAFAGKKRKDISSRHIESVRNLLEGRTGKRCSLPYRVLAGREYDVLWVKQQKEEKLPGETKDTREDSDICIELQLHDGAERRLCLPLEEGRQLEIIWEKTPRDKLSEEVPKNNCTKWFDYARIDGILEFRHPRAGDYFVLAPEGGHKKLNRFLIDRKVPADRRRSVWVLAAGSHVVWIPQMNRSSAGYYVDDTTEEVLCIRYRVVEGCRYIGNNDMIT